jgi:hypothetical protein
VIFEDWTAETYRGYYQQDEQRLGQFFSNALSKVRPTIAKELQNSSADPFYDDNKLSLFLIRCKELWG